METGRTILVVDDEPKIIEVVQSFLESKGYRVFAAQCGKQAYEIFEREAVSLVLLDLMLPDSSGEEICQSIRRTSGVPIIMLTAKVDEEDLLRGLGIGADDYITKPFSLRTLLARVEAVLRRTQGGSLLRHNPSSYNAGDLEIDFDTRIVKKKGEAVSLTPHEFQLLAELIQYPTKVFTREEMILQAFGHDYDGFERTIDSHIKNLRKKIETDPKNPRYVQTIRGVGYRFGGEH